MLKIILAALLLALAGCRTMSHRYLIAECGTDTECENAEMMDKEPKP